MKKFFWKVIYETYPPILRVLEKFRLHNYRQPFLVSRIDSSQKESLFNFLKNKGFEEVVLAWRDPGEILSMRKVDNEVYQYHFRLFKDGEVRGHYEFSSESNPWGHVKEIVFEKREAYFKDLLQEFLK
jgi:hypothetical protein